MQSTKQNGREEFGVSSLPFEVWRESVFPKALRQRREADRKRLELCCGGTTSNLSQSRPSREEQALPKPVLNACVHAKLVTLYS